MKLLNRLYIMNQFKKSMLFRLLIIVTQLKKLTTTQKLMKLKKKILAHNHCKYITAQEFNNLTAENFTARLKQKC